MLSQLRTIRLSDCVSDDNKLCYIKYPKLNHFHNKKLTAINEGLAYRICQQLQGTEDGTGDISAIATITTTLPITVALEVYPQVIIDSYLPKELGPCFGLFYSFGDGYVATSLQQYIEAHAELNPIDIDEANEANEANEVDEVGAADKLLSQLNVDSVSWAIVTNRILGRTDAGPQNSLIDKQCRVVDFDNEYIGATKTSYWLVPICCDSQLPQYKYISDVVVDRLLSLADSGVDSGVDFTLNILTADVGDVVTIADNTTTATTTATTTSYGSWVSCYPVGTKNQVGRHSMCYAITCDSDDGNYQHLRC